MSTQETLPLTRAVADVLLTPAIKLAREIATELRESGDIREAEIFDAKAEEMETSARQVGVKPGK